MKLPSPDAGLVHPARLIPVIRITERADLHPHRGTLVIHDVDNEGSCRGADRRCRQRNGTIDRRHDSRHQGWGNTDDWKRERWFKPRRWQRRGGERRNGTLRTSLTTQSL